MNLPLRLNREKLAHKILSNQLGELNLTPYLEKLFEREIALAKDSREHAKFRPMTAISQRHQKTSSIDDRRSTTRTVFGKKKFSIPELRLQAHGRSDNTNLVSRNVGTA